MTIHEDVKHLEETLDQVESVEELRERLAQKGLKFIVIFITNKFFCWEWNITQKQVSRFVDLGLRIRISRISDETELLETTDYIPVRMKDTSWVDLDELFVTLKQGIKNALKQVK